ncbi:Facilitated trehalose transporter Tret1 [Eumeta japonica]|uniref:Facilitated trehalose transporter Tret1 n=1 Tax=Eumeta variegata TaxID=151549 RepID=A0A4C1XEK3_EUMVA|nr:Facilitated trehalose transporter Tret1 [Eumeta japonica]
MLHNIVFVAGLFATAQVARTECNIPERRERDNDIILPAVTQEVVPPPTSNFFCDFERLPPFKAALLRTTLITATAGTCYGWPSPTIPYLQSNKSTIPTSHDQGSWIVSIMILCSALTPVPSAYFADRFGRKTTLLLGAVPFILGWVLIIVANSVPVLYVARMFSGLGYGIVYTVAPMYTGEIATNEVRGALSTLITLMNKIGILSQYCIGPYVKMHTLASINLILPILFVVTFIFMPESPYYYLRFERTERAERSLRRLRQGDIRTELKSIEINVQEDMRNRGTWCDLVRVPTNRKSLWISLGIFTIQQLCGSAAVVAYAQNIFGKTNGLLEAHEQSMILGLVQVCTCVLSVILVDRVGRKPLLLLSALGVGLMNGTLGTYYFFQAADKDSVGHLHWVPLAAILIYIVCYAIGLSTVPYVIIGEMFPTNVKLYASCIAHIYTGIAMFAVQKLFQVVGDMCGIYTVFWGFCAFSLLGLVFMMVALPETKGKSFASIQAQLRREVVRDNSNTLMASEY